MHQGREEVRNPDHQVFGKHRVIISLFTANTGSQVLTERSGCLIGSCWDILLFWASLEFWGFFVFCFSQRKKKTTLSLERFFSWLCSLDVCWVFSLLWVKSWLHVWDFTLLMFLAYLVSTSKVRGRQYLQSAVVTLPGWWYRKCHDALCVWY